MADDAMKEIIKEALIELEQQYSWPPEVHFKRHRVPPPPAFYIGPDDFLQVAIFTTLTTTNLTLYFRWLDPSGTMHYQRESLDGVTVSTLTTRIFRMSEGWLMGVSVSNLGGGLADQVCFVMLGLQSRAQTGTPPHTVLAQGYVSNLFTVDWPPVYVRGPATAGGAVVLIQQQVVSTPSNTVTFSSIPQIYSKLLLNMYGRTSDAALNENVVVNFNGDSGTNYDLCQFHNTGAAVSGFSASAASSATSGIFPGSTATAGNMGVVLAEIPGYAQTTFNKIMESLNPHFDTNGTTTTYNNFVLANQWRNTAAITSILITDQGGGNFVAGSTFTLYGAS